MLSNIFWDNGEKWIIGLGLLAILDFGWAYHTKARYFALHGVWNMLITTILLPDMYQTIVDPLNAIKPSNIDFTSIYEANRWPIIFITLLHFWHCVAYGILTYDDYFHHIVFASILCVINFCWEWGYSTNFAAFFLCGFPGGVDYLMLLAVKHDYIDKMTEKEWNRILNVWCRGPGCIAAACVIWVNWVAGNTGHIPIFIKLFTIILLISNGQYYSGRVIVSWANHKNTKFSHTEVNDPISFVYGTDTTAFR